MPRHHDALPGGRIRRTRPLAGFTARAGGGRLVAGLGEKAGDDGAVDRFHERTAERYTELLGHSKGALMKIGQMISMTDAGGLGSGGFAPYQRALIRLQADAPPMAPALVPRSWTIRKINARNVIGHWILPSAAAAAGNATKVTTSASNRAVRQPRCRPAAIQSRVTQKHCAE